VGHQISPPTAPTDSLIVEVAGVTNLVLASASNTFGLAGNYTFGNRAEVDFQDLATTSPIPPLPPPPVCTPTVPALSTTLLVALGLLIAVMAWPLLSRRVR